MKHLGDITKIHGGEVPVVDCVIGGSPCQDLSVAGKQAGLGGERSGLFLEQIRIVKEMREADVLRGRTGQFIRPRYCVWENVPGAFSSGKPKGADFARVLEEFIRLAEPDACVQVCIPKNGWTKSGCYYADDGRWSLAWRVHDSQFWGVPQRRNRIALVMDLGGLSAPEILFERKGLSGDFTQGGAQRQAAAAGTGVGAEEPKSGVKCMGFPLGFRPENVRCYEEAATTICNGTRPGFTAGVLMLDDQGGSQISVRTDGIAPTLRAEMHGNIQAVMEYYGFKSGQGAKANGIGWQKDVSQTLAATPSGTNQAPAVVYDARGNGDGQTCNTITGDHNDRITDYSSVVAERQPDNQYIVRRLTPLECERLQGFPDGWTDIGDWTDSKGKRHKAADSPRYKALGNSIALPFWKWLIKRLCAQYGRDATMASLFDGIGGFPYLWEQINGKGSCLFASEIEEFPMAVTKRRFGDE